jgi:hypothetical protein
MKPTAMTCATGALTSDAPDALDLFLQRIRRYPLGMMRAALRGGR